MRHSGQGFTLIELMVAIAVLAIFITVAIPSFMGTIEKQRVRNAVEKVYADLGVARSQAIKANRRQFFSLNPGAAWCYGIDDTALCDCGTAGDCTVEGGPRVTDATDFGNTTLATDLNPAAIVFEPRRGLPQDGAGNPLGGSITVTSAGGLSAQVQMNVIGRLSICSNDTQLGYSACP